MIASDVDGGWGKERVPEGSHAWSFLISQQHRLSVGSRKKRRATKATRNVDPDCGT